MCGATRGASIAAFAICPAVQPRHLPDPQGELGTGIFLGFRTKEERQRYADAMKAEGVPVAGPGGSVILPIVPEIEQKVTVTPRWPSFSFRPRQVHPLRPRVLPAHHRHSGPLCRRDDEPQVHGARHRRCHRGDAQSLPGNRAGVAVKEIVMRAAILNVPARTSLRPLEIASVPQPELRPGHVLIKVKACGVCRTDLHIVEGDLPPKCKPLIPGHQIVGEIAGGATPALPLGTRVGVSWIGGTDGTCRYCLQGRENLCDAPTFTGYSVNGGYAEYALARNDFVFLLPAALDDLRAAPLLCAGIIGFRSLRVAGVEPGDHVGLYGFGAAAHLAIAVLHAWKCTVYVATRGASHRALAATLGPPGWAARTTGHPWSWTAPSPLPRRETL